MKRQFWYLLTFMSTLWACSKETAPDGYQPENQTLEHGMIVLGEKLDDPYSVSNVQKALESLYPTKAGVKVQATDKYVRFLPADQTEYETLTSKGFLLIDHPLDYRIVKEGDYYHDPSLSEDEITWQYSVVSADAELPENIYMEVLDQCYIPENDSGTRSSDIDWNAVEKEAFRISGNGDMLASDTKSDFDPGNPGGRICIIDDEYNDGEPLPVSGVKVMCNTFVKFATAYTDEEGYYKINRTFSTELRYRIVFQSKKGFSIGFNKILIPASTSTLGTNPPQGVSITVDKNSDRTLFCRCAVCYSANEYYTRCKESDSSIGCPPSNTRIWIFQRLEDSSTMMLQHGVLIDDTVIGNYLGEYKEILKVFLPDITLGLKGFDDLSSIYGVTAHELAHASHFSKAGKSFWNNYISFILTSFVISGGRLYGLGDEEMAGYCEVGEMWAFYMQNKMMEERYGENGVYAGMSYWFHPQILHYLDERGIGRGKLFEGLVSASNTRLLYQNKLVELYPEYQTIINQAFERYSE